MEQEMLEILHLRMNGTGCEEMDREDQEARERRRKEIAIRTWQAISRMKTNHAWTLILRFMMDFERPEIARATGRSRQAVEKMEKRALKSFKQVYR